MNEAINAAREARAAYYKKHVACPVCGGTEIRQTYVGYVVPPDKNSAICSCGWKGIVDELVEKS